MKYLQQHPIHEDKNPMTDPYKTHDEAEVRKTHNDADKYAGAGKQAKAPTGEHHLSDATVMKTSASSIAGTQPTTPDSEHNISHIANQKSSAKSIAGQNGGHSDDEQQLSDIAESRIIRFSDFN